MSLEKGGQVARHTTMPKRRQRTPYGDVTLTSRWMRDQYYLVASAPNPEALKWLFPNLSPIPERYCRQYRHAFKPAPNPVTVERTLRQLCGSYQRRWMERLEEWEAGQSEETAHDEEMPATLGQLIEHLFPERRKRLKPRTLTAEEYALRQWQTLIDWKTPLHEIDRRMIQRAYDQLTDRLKPNSVNRLVGVLSVYLNWAAEEQLLNGDPHKRIERRRTPRQRPTAEWWTFDEVQLALRCARELDVERQAKSDRLATYATAELFIAMGCYLGLRTEEIVMQRYQNLDLDACDAQSGDSKPVCHVVPHSGWDPKTKEARTIPIHRDLLGILQRHRRTEGYVLQPYVRRKKRGGTQGVYRYDPRNLFQQIIDRVIAAGGRRITMYGMRHSFASNYLIAGVSDVKVARWLGHNSTTMLHRHYGHLLAYDDDVNRLG